MDSILRFNDLACLNESASGSLGAGLAVFARADFPVVRGFVVTPLVFSDFLKKPEIRSALNLYKTGAEDPKESWRNVKAVFNRSRLMWNHEMDILTAFRELDATTSILTTSKYGTSASPVYAHTGQDLLDGIKHCWLRWLKKNMEKLEQQDMPAVLIREIFDSEASIELRKKNMDIIARAAFGLPEGLNDPAVSGDIYEFNPDGELARMEQREQKFQYVMQPQGPVKVDVDPEFSTEEKATGEMLSGLDEIMKFMRENPGIERCGICFVSYRPVICYATQISPQEGIVELPIRETSLTLMEKPGKAPLKELKHGPVIATKLFVALDSQDSLGTLNDEYIEGMLISSKVEAKDIPEIASEAKRRFRTSQIVLEMNPEDDILSSIQEIIALEMEPGILIPGIRSSDELSKVIKDINSALEGITPRAKIWVRIMYPSNLFFMDSLAKHSDALALDLDMLGRLMLGGGEDGHWLIFSHEALEKALGEALDSSQGMDSSIAVISEDLVSMPSLLEFLVRNGTEILCVMPRDLQTIRHIVASVEKRMLLEAGRNQEA